MFIPFDRLYDYLDHLIHESTIIYRFDPVWSRNIASIRQHNEKNQKFTYTEHKEMKVMLIHDQEPLGLDSYDAFTSEGLSYFLKDPQLNLFKFQEQIYQDYKKLGPMILNILSLMVYDKILLTHSELDSPALPDYEKLGAIGVYWWSHASIAHDWYRYAEIDPCLNFSDKQYQYDFNIYNRSWNGTREYRLKFTDLLLQRQIIDHCKIKFSPMDQSVHYTQHIFKNRYFRPESDLEVLPINTAGPESSADYSSFDYNECGIDVVLETLFDDKRKHLTEKTLRPIACGKPFILVSTPGSLGYLKSYGFDTFSGIIDESYDSIQDPLERLTAIVDLMESISNMPEEKKDAIFYKMHQIAQENKRKFWSDKFHKNIIDEFVENYTLACNELEKYKQGKNWIEFRKKLRSWDPTINLSRESEWRSRKELLSLQKKLYYNRKLST